MERVSVSYVPLEARVYTVHSARSLLMSASYKKLFEDLATYTFVEKAMLETFYYKLMGNFAEFVQLLPVPEGSSSRSMLMSSTRRAFLMLSAFSQEMLAVYGKPYLQSSEGARLLYAVFSASLLFEIGKICATRKIVLTDEKGNFQADWDYFNGSLLQYGQYYKIRFGEGMPQSLTSEVTYVLAKQLMPELGFAWLAEDYLVLQRWFVALTVRDEFFGAYKMSFEVTEDLEKNPLELEDQEWTYIEPVESLEAEKFWEWLLDKVKKDPACVNDGESGIYWIEDEFVFDHKQLMQDFGKVYSNFSGAVVLATQFNYIGVTQLDGQDYRYKQYFSAPENVVGSTASGLFQGRSKRKALTNMTLVGLNKSASAFYFKSELIKRFSKQIDYKKVPDKHLDSPLRRARLSENTSSVTPYKDWNK